MSASAITERNRMDHIKAPPFTKKSIISGTSQLNGTGRSARLATVLALRTAALTLEARIARTASSSKPKPALAADASTGNASAGRLTSAGRASSIAGTGSARGS